MLKNGIKAIITDFDDTVFDSRQGVIPVSFWKTRNFLISQGYEVIIATGRPWHSLRNQLTSLGIIPESLCTPLICSDGALMIDREGNKLVNEVFDTKEASEIFEYLKILGAAGVKINIGANGVRGAFYYKLSSGTEDQLFARFLNGMTNEIEGISDIIDKYQDRPISMFWTCPDLETNSAVRQLLLRAFPQLESGPRLFELQSGHIISSGWSKKDGVQALLQKLSISEDEVLVIGDGDNDVLMLEHFKHSIAMGNAQEWVKPHAKHVAPPLRDDGWSRGVVGLLSRLEGVSWNSLDTDDEQSTTSQISTGPN